MLERWGMWSIPSMPSLQRPHRPGVVALDKILYIGQIELNYVLMLNQITWNSTVLTFKLRTYTNVWMKQFLYAKLSSWKRNVFDIGTVLKLNWIIWLCVNKNYTYAKLNCLK